MGGVVAIGARGRVQPFALAGVDWRDATTPDDVRAAWSALPRDTVLVLLTPEARRALDGELAAVSGLPLWAELPP
jgi:vacuolar-type H+-ATPase subunit F/Vma7